MSYGSVESFLRGRPPPQPAGVFFGDYILCKPSSSIGHAVNLTLARNIPPGRDIRLKPSISVVERRRSFCPHRLSVFWPWLLTGVRSPLVEPGEIDMLVLRENSEGEYVRCGGRAKQGLPGEIAVQSAIHTRKGVERILRFGGSRRRSKKTAWFQA